jgi:glycerol uptake facilitator-like aquaporin
VTTNPDPNLARKLTAEAMGTLLLVAVVVGSGIMAHNLSGGNAALALLGNTLATAAILPVLIIIFAPLSGAHFNPAVTVVMTLRRELPVVTGMLYIAAQTGGGIAGTVLAHLMFGLDPVSFDGPARTGPDLWLAEVIAAFGLILVILAGARHRPHALPYLVGLYIAAGYWFTSSTCFANPAVTIARAFTASFAGINPADIAPFIMAQITGALAATVTFRWLYPVKL